MKENNLVVLSAKSKMSLGCCIYGFDAEVEVEMNIAGKYEKFYVSNHTYDGTYYGVTKSSIFDEENYEIEFLEEYDNLEDAKKSVFGKCFEIVDRMVDELGNHEKAV